MVADALAAARPSATEAFRDTVLLFQAIRAHDADGLARLLAGNPALATGTEDWSPVEGFESRLGFSERATALVRAAGTGDLRLVRRLVEAGAPVADLCPCADHESALVTAVNIGAPDVVDYLLDHGASVDGGALTGNPPPFTWPCTESGTISCAGCWRPAPTRPRPTPTAAPPRTGARSRPPAGPRRTTAMSCGPDPSHRSLRATAARGPGPHPARLRARRDTRPVRRGRCSRAGSLVDDRVRAWPYEPVEFKRETRDSGTAATIDLVGPGHPADRRRQFAAILERLAASPGRKVVTCVPAPGHEHDITVGLPGLAADPSVLATVVVATYTPGPPTIPQALPEGFDARITFDPARARARAGPLSTQTAPAPGPIRTAATSTSPAPPATRSPTTPSSTPCSRCPTRPRSTTRLLPSRPRRSCGT